MLSESRIAERAGDLNFAIVSLFSVPPSKLQFFTFLVDAESLSRSPSPAFTSAAMTI